MQQLQEQDSDVIYSKQPEENIKIIPPSSKPKKQEGIKVMPPVAEVEEEKPKTIKFKLAKKEQPVEQEVKRKPPTVVIPKKKEDTVVKNKQQNYQKPVKNVQSTTNRTVSSEDLAEKLFKMSETHPSLKSKWLDVYNTALESKKDNYAMKKIRQGQFMLDDKGVWFFPDNYDVRGKSSNDILKDSWLNNLM